MRDTGPFALWRWELLFKSRNQFIAGLGNTLIISVAALALSIVLGVLFGIMSKSNSKLLRAIARIYVEFFQNTPLAVQIFFMFNALPFIGIRLNFLQIGIIGIALYHGAYVAEVVRAGINSISFGQTEAALSQGFSHLQAMQYIILPQTVKVILPPLTNQAVNLIKNTSILNLIAGAELMYAADTWASNGTLSYGPAYLTAAVLYFLLCFPLASFARNYEDKLKNRENLPLIKEELL